MERKPLLYRGKRKTRVIPLNPTNDRREKIFIVAFKKAPKQGRRVRENNETYIGTEKLCVNNLIFDLNANDVSTVTKYYYYINATTKGILRSYSILFLLFGNIYFFSFFVCLFFWRGTINYILVFGSAWSNFN